MSGGGYLFFTVSIVWKGAPLDEPSERLGLVPDPEAARRFRRFDEAAHRFTFNDSFLRERAFAYLGRQFVDIGGALGRSRLDVTATTYGAASTQVLSVHVKPALDALADGARADLPADLVHDLALFVSTSLFGQTSATRFADTALHAALAAVAETAPARAYALPYSTHTCVSLCGLSDARYAGRLDRMATDIYSLLFAHADGVAPEMARAYLEQNQWSSTNFFTTYYQPGALIAVSRPYPPELYAARRTHFLQSDLDADPACAAASVGDGAAAPSPTGRAIGYDMLPEYPPLRYVALLPGVFATVFEENLRDAYDRLLTLQQRSAITWRFWRIVGRERELNRIGVALAVADNFEHLRLPITRSLVRQLIDAKLQDNVVSNVRDLKGSNLNALVFMLTVIATVIAIWQALPTDALADVAGRLAFHAKAAVKYGLCLIQSSF